MKFEHVYSELRSLLYGVTVGTALFISSCKESPVGPVINNPPRITQEIAPLEGISPLQVKIKAIATDYKGVMEDIVSFRTVIKNNVNSDSLIFLKNPLDTTLTLKTPLGIEKVIYTANSTAINRKGVRDFKETNVTVYHPSTYVLQTATLQNRVDIKYNVLLRNLNEARLDVLKDTRKILSRLISTDFKDTTYTETFSYSNNREITKGRYDFVLNWKTLSGKDTSLTSRIEIPNYLPEINLSNLQAELDEDSEITLNLEDRIKNSDPNPEDSPVLLKGAESIDGKTQVITSGYNIRIKGLEGKVGSYKVRLEAGSEQGGIKIETLDGLINDLLDIHGYLEDSGKHERQQGVIKVFNENELKLGEIQTNTGEFRKRLGQRIRDLTDYILIQGRAINTAGENKSYIRTIKLPKGDVKNLELRVVSYDGLAENDVSVEDFSRHVREVLTYDGNKGTGDPINLNPVLFKYNFGEDPNASVRFEKVVISKRSMDTTVTVQFSQSTCEELKSRILNPDDIGAWFRGKIKKVEIFDYYEMSLDPFKNVGILFVYPSKLGAYAGSVEFAPQDGYIDYSTAWIAPSPEGNINMLQAAQHEIGGHASGQMGHAFTLPHTKTHMSKAYNSGSPKGPPTPIDKKTSQEVIYEDSYIHGQGDYNPYYYSDIRPRNLLRVNYILGLKFFDER